MKVLIVFYSMYGHIQRMAEAVAEGAKEVVGAEVIIRRVQETLSQDVLEKMGALEAQKSMAHIPVCTVEELAEVRCDNFRNTDPFRQHVRSDAPVPRCNRRALGEGLPHRQGGQRLYQLEHSAWRSGIDNPQLSHHLATSGHGDCRPALCLSRTDAQ